jgi:hypothetical protein
MAAKSDARLRRTQRGQHEIRQKSHVLTQSERLILVLADGYTSVDILRRKLQGVTDRYFKLSVADLMAKGFIEKVVVPNRQPDVLDVVLAEHFVRQDPLDPVTINELTLQPKSKKVAQVNIPPEKKAAGNDAREPVQTDKLDAEPGQSESAGVDFYLPLEAPLNLPKAPVFQMPVATELIMGNSADPIEVSDRQIKRARRGRRMQIGYGLLFLGLVCAMILIVLLKTR